MADRTGAYATLAHRLQGGPIPSVAAAIEDLRTEPLRAALGELLEACRPVLAGPGRRPPTRRWRPPWGACWTRPPLLGHHTDRRRAFTQFPADLATLAQVADALDGRPPACDPAWLVVWAVTRLFPGGRSGAAAGGPGAWKGWRTGRGSSPWWSGTPPPPGSGPAAAARPPACAA